MVETRPTFIDINQAVRETGLSTYRLRQMIKNGEVPYFEAGKKYLLHREKLLEYLLTVSIGNTKR